jgi:acetyltransferase
LKIIKNHPINLNEVVCGSKGVILMYERLFSPRGVAIVGASQNTSKLGYGAARNLVVSNFQGEIYFVNPNKGRLFDRDIYPDVASVPDPVDLAIILIPAAAVPGVLEDCGKRGISFVIIGSGGFKETGSAGKELESECLEIAQRYGIRVIGPNCIGFLDTHLPIDTTFLPLPGAKSGDIACLSHSGAICEAVIDWSRGQGFGLSRLVSLGNQMDLTETDLLASLAEDENTSVITMYLEGVGDGLKFIEEAKKASMKKPIVAIKVGRTEHGREAVASHTGALAGRDVAFDAAFELAGVIRAHTSEEMFDWARALAWCSLPKGRRVAVLTNAGGPGAIAMDALDTEKLIPAELAPHTLERMRSILPPAASLRNPVDMLATAGPSEYANCLRALLADEGVDSVMIILPPPPMVTAAEIAGAIIPVVRSTSKPVIVVLMGEELIYHAAHLFRQAHVPDYRFPERAASALGVLAKRVEQLAATPLCTIIQNGIDRDKVEGLLGEHQPGAGGFLKASTAAEIISSYGIAVADERLVSSAEDAVHAAEEVGYPIVLKLISGDLLHKSDVGGVVVGVDDADEVRDAYQKLMSNIEIEQAGVSIEGVGVQKMLEVGQEVIIGATRDPQFGPLVMFGSGGIEVEGLKDIAFALAPVNRREAEKLLEKTWAGQRLAGYRSIVPVDREAVVEAILRVGQLVVDFPQIAELEINPLMVLPKAPGAIAVDVRMKIDLS